MPYYWYTESAPTTGGVWRWSAITSTGNTTATTYYPSATVTSSSPYTNTIPLSEYHRRMGQYDLQLQQHALHQLQQAQLAAQQAMGIRDDQIQQQSRPRPAPLAAPAVLRHDHRAAADEVHARYERHMREAAERTARVKAADDRARQLLLSHLTPEQVEQFNRHGGFIVIGESGIRYRVRCDRGVSGNVESLDGERAVMRYCAHMSVDLPSADHFLAQKFMLEHDEAAFLRIANRVAASG